ncbi:ABC transporter permease [Amantichitinum ursilacus]|uniref:Bicarbonate transport system permease protein CmpB n=1 Tax=Amantichitinum ursilacus TaxID=857265 RepID=A0A0N1JRG1_9NEIS|nr:ABC transporter permease [Amantichitinum ursilacus]KPC49608.1 Bicarbonate transport system permease protein CmpB [Amantichitinum ursilacus]
MTARVSWPDRLRGLAIPAALLLLWQWAAHHSTAYAYAFVPFEQVWRGAVQALESGGLLPNLGASLARTCAGLLIGSVLGLALGGVLAMSTLADKLAGTLFHALRQVPLLAWAPLIGLWFGNSEPARLLVISLAALYPVTLNTFEGLHQAESRHLELASLYQLTAWQQFWRVRLPAALPHVFTGLMHALTFAWISAVGAEMLFSAGPGIGSMMLTAETNQQMEIVLICVITISAMGTLMNHALTLAARRLLRWHR